MGPHQLYDPILQQDLVVNRVMTLFNRVGGDGIFAKDGWNDYQLGNDTVILFKSIKRLIFFTAVLINQNVSIIFSENDAGFYFCEENLRNVYNRVKLKVIRKLTLFRSFPIITKSQYAAGYNGLRRCRHRYFYYHCRRRHRLIYSSGPFYGVLSHLLIVAVLESKTQIKKESTAVKGYNVDVGVDTSWHPRLYSR